MTNLHTHTPPPPPYTNLESGKFECGLKIYPPTSHYLQKNLNLIIFLENILQFLIIHSFILIRGHSLQTRSQKKNPFNIYLFQIEVSEFKMVSKIALPFPPKTTNPKSYIYMWNFFSIHLYYFEVWELL